MQNSLIVALGLLLLFEGIVPLIFPRHWKQAFSRIIQFADGQLRFFGLISVMCGLALLGLGHIFR